MVSGLPLRAKPSGLGVGIREEEVEGFQELRHEQLARPRYYSAEQDVSGTEGGTRVAYSRYEEIRQLSGDNQAESAGPILILEA